MSLFATGAALLMVGDIALALEAPANHGFTVPSADFNATANDAGCPTTMSRCTGNIFGLSHDVAGTVTVIDDCTFQVDGWEYDGLGPAVAWWAAAASGPDDEFPYPANAKFVALLTRAGGGELDYVTGETERAHRVRFFLVAVQVDCLL